MWNKKLDTSETIYALCSGALPSAVAIVRISGPLAFSILRKLFVGEFREERGMWYGTLRKANQEYLDSVLVLTFQRPFSFTGEDVVELQCHGSIAIVEELNTALSAAGARQASRGEFSYRAFLNGKTSAQALDTLGDVYQAKEGSELSALYRRSEDSLKALITRFRESLIQIQAVLDTAVDFSEEYSAAILHIHQPLRMAIHECSLAIQRHIAFRESLPLGRIALIGLPNAGKSSLFNALLCRHRALVHESAGTTRDVIEEDIVIDGSRWKLVDTAGVREAKSESEREGIQLGKDFASHSDICLCVIDQSEPFSQSDFAELSKVTAGVVIFVRNKCDKEPAEEQIELQGNQILVSARMGLGIEKLWQAIAMEVRKVRQMNCSDVIPSRSQYEKLNCVLGELQELQSAVDKHLPPEYLAEKSRSAMGRVEEIIGPVDTEQVLDRVFGEFCIGK